MEVKISKRKASRPTIGVLVDTILYEYQSKIWKGIVDSAEGKNINLICFVGRRIYPDFDIYANKIYDLIGPKNVDGLIIMSAAISSDLEKTKEFCKKYFPLPIVSIGLEVEGIPSILVDNRSGIKEALTHLIEHHGYRRIAFIRGPLNHQEAEERYNSYLETLAQYNIPFDSQLIVNGDFLRLSGVEGIKTLLDERKVDFEAILVSNDLMALGVFDVLKERGIRVPYDLAIVGFDDAEEVQFVNPPFTTVRQPLHEIGAKACEAILDLINGKEIPEKIILPTKLITRQSCGCKSPLVLQAGREVKVKEEDFNLLISKDKILSKVLEDIGEDSKFSKILDEIFDSFINSLNKKSPSKFLTTLEHILTLEEKESFSPEIWQTLISVFRENIISFLKGEKLTFAENMFHQARVLIWEITRRNQGYKRLETENWIYSLSNITQALTSTFALERFAEVVAQEFKRLEIPSCYISLYEDKEKLKYSKLLLAYDRNGNIDLKNLGKKFLSSKLLPGNMLNSKRRRTFIAEPLYFEDKSLGYILFELGPRSGVIYETLRGQISSALYGALLFKERNTALENLQKHVRELSILNEIGNAINSAIELERLWELIYQQTCKLIDSPGFYIALYDENKKEIRTVFDIVDGQRRRENEKSRPFTKGRTGYIITKKKPLLIRGDVEKIYKKLNIVSSDEKAKAFAGVPIIVKGKVIGVLALQHYDHNTAYDEHTIELLSVIATQAGIAIENARLFEETKRLATVDPLTGVWNRRYLEEALRKEIARSSRYHHHLSVFVLDIDNLKLLNDTYGHLVGDDVIRTIAHVIQSSCRKIDIVGRYGGDEFAVILPETDSSGAVTVAKRILLNLKKTSLNAPNRTKIPLSVSIGISSYPTDSEDAERLFSLADTAMYRAKIAGGGKFATLSQELEKTSKEFSLSFDALTGLLMTIDNKDNYTLRHSNEVSEIACALARALNLPEEDIKAIEIAGKLHDIGKIGIPNGILRKPGPLTPEERKIIQEHPHLGYLIMQQLPQMEKVLKAILHHHERYDGKGYPNGIQGENIPIIARILALADAYSAMRSDRPYRRALTVEEAIEEIKNNMGKQFDPDLAEKLIELIKKGEINK